MAEIASNPLPRLVAVLVTHNGGPWLRRCLAALARQTYSNLDIIVVDNGSETPPAALVTRVLPAAEFIWVERNLGFGTACNYALGASSKTSSAEYFLFLHDDVQLERRAAKVLIDTAVKTGAGIVGGKGHDWEKPEVLVEVGMSADQFCFPFSGLEDGEIDQGQHEGLRETLFVTNACMLVSRATAMRCGLWDGAYFAFGEDLDLCLRARLAGFKVMVQPAVRYRHAAALSNGLRQAHLKTSHRLLQRRNQLRTIAKNFHLYRTVPLITICILLGTFKVLVLAALRRFDEIPDYPRALAGFIGSSPDLLRRRRAVQKRRSIPDRRIRRFMVGDVQRVRVRLEHRLRHIERGTLAFGAKTISQFSPSSLRRSLAQWLRRPSTVSVGLIALILVIALRKVIFGPPIASGSLWPFPEAGSRLLGDYFAHWRDTQLGSQSAAPPALPILWLVSLPALGNAVLAQKLLILISIAIGMMGMNRLVRRSAAGPPAGVVAVGLYGLGPVVHQMVSTADVTAMAMYAGLPFILDLALKILGSGDQKTPREQTPLDVDEMVRDSARLALVVIPVVALGPSNLMAIAYVYLLLGAFRLGAGGVLDHNLRRVGYLSLSLALAALGLIPWFLEAFRPGGAILSPLFSGRGGSLFGLWSSRTFEHMLLLNIDGRLGALVTLGVAAGALVLAGPLRRQESRLLATAWIGFALMGGLAAKGVISPPVVSASAWMIVPLAVVAAFSGHAVAGIREELPKHSFGWRQRVATPAVGLMVGFGLLLAWVPTLPRWERPTSSFAGGTGEFSQSISSFLTSTADEAGDFRVLWLGSRWAAPVRSGLRPMNGIDYFLTGPEGLNMLDLQEPPVAQGEDRLERAVAALLGRKLHLAGHLLAPANIRFVVADPRDGPSISALRRQRDIVLEQQVSGVAIFRNLNWLPRVVLAPVDLAPRVTGGAANDRALMLVDWSGGRPVPRRSQSSFSLQLPRTRHSQVLVGENFNAAWRAWVGDQRLEHSQAFGWANRFELSPQARGEITVSFGRRWLRFFWLAVQALILAGLAAMARSVLTVQSPRPR